jgi:hypothetical protein
MSFSLTSPGEGQEVGARGLAEPVCKVNAIRGGGRLCAVLLEGSVFTVVYCPLLASRVGWRGRPPCYELAGRCLCGQFFLPYSLQRETGIVKRCP